jgi:cation diffusion facilitator CzcD-associated flavoprotein CzcO
VELAIVGTGFSGLGMAIRAMQAGFDDLVVLERAGDVGGTWRDNTYPGAACDVPSHLYSYSFAPNPSWSRSFSDQQEIWAYLRSCAHRYGVWPYIRFGRDVRGARWEEHAQRWRVITSNGEWSARYLVAGMGPLSEPSVPELPGLATFDGALWHSARWDHEFDLKRKRVAVIGTGASAIQFVPQIQPDAARLHLFQRTAPWVMPRRDRGIRSMEQAVFQAVPAAQQAARGGIFWGREALLVMFRGDGSRVKAAQHLARRHLEHQVPDAGLRGKLTPSYAMGCKRILLSDDYYPAVAQPNVELVTDRILEVRPGGITTADRVDRDVDAIIFGTGFHATEPPAADAVWGRNGVLLKDAWAGGMEAYKGTTVAGYPNLFFLVGPNTGLGHNSMVYIIESQLAYVVDTLKHLRARGATVAEVRPEAQQQWNDQVQAGLANTVWSRGGCVSWYLDAGGRNSTLWPGFCWQFRRAVRRFDPDAYLVR